MHFRLQRRAAVGTRRADCRAVIRDDVIGDIQRVPAVGRGYAHPSLVIKVRIGIEALVSVHRNVLATHVFIRLYVSSFQNGAGAG